MCRLAPEDIDLGPITHYFLRDDDEHEVDSCPRTSMTTHSPPISGVKRATPTTARAVESSKKHRFAELKSDDEVKQAQEKVVPEKTKQNTSWCINQWRSWAEYHRVQRTSSTHPLPVEFLEMSDEELNYRVPRFVLEVRKKDSTYYPPESLYQLVCGLQRYLHQNGRPEVKLVTGDPRFYDVYQTLDAEMKRLKGRGLGVVKKQAEPITEEEEELLWSKAPLGDHSPRALANTMVYMCGVYFALRSGDEHRRLRHEPSQIEVVEDSERAYLVYREDVSSWGCEGSKAGTENRPPLCKYYEP